MVDRIAVNTDQVGQSGKWGEVEQVGQVGQVGNMVSREGTRASGASRASGRKQLTVLVCMPTHCIAQSAKAQALGLTHPVQVIRLLMVRDHEMQRNNASFPGTFLDRGPQALLFLQCFCRGGGGKVPGSGQGRSDAGLNSVLSILSMCPQCLISSDKQSHKVSMECTHREVLGMPTLEHFDVQNKSLRCLCLCLPSCVFVLASPSLPNKYKSHKGPALFLVV